MKNAIFMLILLLVACDEDLQKTYSCGGQGVSSASEHVDGMLSCAKFCSSHYQPTVQVDCQNGTAYVLNRGPEFMGPDIQKYLGNNISRLEWHNMDEWFK
jgi:hypothetical protein